jgi:Icc-related predicted phosphoesterase
MRLFFTTDIHGSERCFRKLLNAAQAYRADALVLGGDITGKLLVPLVTEPDGRVSASFFGQTRWASGAAEVEALEAWLRQAGSYTVRLTRGEKEQIDADPGAVADLFRRAVTETVRGWIALARERLEARGIPLFLSAGNDDEPYVDEVLGSAEYVQAPEGRVVCLPDGREMISVGYANITPFDSPRELPEEELERRMTDLADQLHDPERAVFNFHCPPHGTTLDLAPKLDADLRPMLNGADVMMAAAGSVATRRTIERYQPIVGLHGHIHESRAAQKLGRTMCFNPGSEYSEGVLRGVLMEFKPNKLKGWQFTNG